MSDDPRCGATSPSIVRTQPVPVRTARQPLSALRGSADCARELSDSDLWRRTAAGDERAFGLLYQRHADAIYGFLVRRSHDWAQAEDLTSVVFLEAYRRRATVEIEDGKVLCWLFGVAANVLRNGQRSLARHRHALRRLPLQEAQEDFSDEVTARLAVEQQSRPLLELVRELPEHEQRALALCVWSEHSYEEAACALGVPIGTVRSRLSRARSRLRTLASAHERDLVAASTL